MKQPTQIVAKVDYIARGAIVTVPQSIEPWHCMCLRGQLLWLLNERIEELVIDFSPTISCAPGIAEVIERVQTRTQAHGVRLSLVLTPDSAAARALHGTGLTRLLRVHPDRAVAEDHLHRAAGAPAAARGSGRLPSPRDPGVVPQAS
ncbi:hypothetical protein LG943_13155 [Streptomonospora sp. S1-112]|uniref:STAS domain-containing protein n=1 Tax=Streptomonospora mangrovi TaxID=2883123 RepID=A0A9X3NLM5_9ACTN|nr:hypothetical protein [Streptomonospora mangrovi]MDA0565255.1 hypothetical protein [Streptomonospora mangrovi]